MIVAVQTGLGLKENKYRKAKGVEYEAEGIDKDNRRTKTS